MLPLHSRFLIAATTIENFPFAAGEKLNAGSNDTKKGQAQKKALRGATPAGFHTICQSILQKLR